MTLRVQVSIVPYGIKEEEYSIHELLIHNITGGEHSEYEVYLDGKPLPRIKHFRSEGALKLVKLILEDLYN